MRHLTTPLPARAALPLAAASGGASAQTTTSPWYGELGLGQSKASVDCAGTISCDDKGVFFRAIIGYEFTPDVSLELSAARLGRIKAAALVPPFGRVDINASLRSIGLGVAGQLPLNDQWSLTGRLGVASNKTSVSGNVGGSTGGDSETSTQPYLGLAVNYAIDKRTQLSATVDRNRIEYSGEKSSVTTLGVAARWRF